MFKIFTILGTRPEIIKLSRIIPLFDKVFDHSIIHTGQNFNYELNEIFFSELKIRKPDVYLDCAKTTSIQTISNILLKFEKYINKNRPDAIFVLGDTNSAYSSLVAKKNKIPIFHYEAGNRCFDNDVPEEINRKIVDHISDLNITYTNISKENLINEGIPSEKIICLGSPMLEILNFYKKQINKSKILNRLSLKRDSYFLVSLHREENVDDKKTLINYVDTILFLCKKYKKKIIFSTHYRTQKNLKKYKLDKSKDIYFAKPFGFLDYMKLQQNSFLTLSDSGTLSEESSILGINSIHLRHCTERPEGLENGAIILSGFNKNKIVSTIELNKITKKKIDNHKNYSNKNISSTIAKSIISFLNYYKK